MSQRLLFALSANIQSLVCISMLQPTQAGDPATRGPQRKVRVGVITQEDGPHWGIYFSAIANSSSVSGVAVADSNGTTFETAKTKFGRRHDFQPYRNPQIMLREFQPDLVIVALAAHRASAQIWSALSAGCHVLAENRRVSAQMTSGHSSSWPLQRN